jgi:outer membrane protein OmpA-like peptidoglycan-associated protein
VTPQRIRSIGRGEDAPIASNLTPEGRQQNRRVEIIITPNQ